MVTGAGRCPSTGVGLAAMCGGAAASAAASVGASRTISTTSSCSTDQSAGRPGQPPYGLAPLLRAAASSASRRLALRSAQQLAALARDFFDSFTCTAAGCTRPDPMDQGRPYRSVLGVPGGMDGPLFGVLAAANTRGMALTRGHGDEGEAANTVLAHGSNPTPAPASPHPCPCPYP